ncbi:MAG: thioredoxin-dependent thiol peroxidase [Anaerolineae bacterium]|nr:thioredoxin-dependent thiol peroxidase [Anaerolineae bacterium]
MLKYGDPAPDFTLTSDRGEQVSLSDFRGQKVVVYFFPKAGTSGCTRQACSIRDLYPRIQVQATVVIGISPDSPEELARFRQRHNLPFVLLSDPDHRVAMAYDAWGRKKAFGRETEGIIRSHFAVDEEGRILRAEWSVRPDETATMAVALDQP